MRRNIYAAALVAAMMLVAACSDNEIVNNLPEEQPQNTTVKAPRISADIENGGNTRAGVVEGNDNYTTEEFFKWEVNDEILVLFVDANNAEIVIPYKVDKVNETAPNRCTFAPNLTEGQETGLNADTEYTVYGLYPASAWTEMRKGGEAVADLVNQVQTGNKTSSHIGKAQLMKAEAKGVTVTEEGGNIALTYNQLAGVMRFVIKNNTTNRSLTVKSISLSTNTADCFVQTATLNTTNNTPVAESLTNELVLTVNNAEAVNTGNAFHGFISIFPTATPLNDLVVQVTLTDENNKEFKTTRFIDLSGETGFNFEAATAYSFILSVTDEYFKVLTVTEGVTITNTDIANNIRPDGTLAVEGTVTAADVNVIGAWGRDTKTEGKVKIESLDLSGATSVTLPGALFTGLTLNSELKYIMLPPGLTEISEYAFTYCSALTKVDMPENLESIGKDAFSGCSALKEINIPECVTSIGLSAFNGCSALKEINIPEGVTSIGSSAFEGCSALKEINIPEGIETIENGTFGGCSALKSINMPESIKTIGVSAFSGCSALESINIPEDVTSIGQGAFSGCTTLKEIAIPESVTSIGKQAFMNCTALEEINIPTGIKEIGRAFFKGCASLENITIPSAVEVIGAEVFSDSGIKSIIFEGNMFVKSDNSNDTPNAQPGYLVLADKMLGNTTNCNIFLPAITGKECAYTYRYAMYGTYSVWYNYNTTGDGDKTNTENYTLYVVE